MRAARAKKTLMRMCCATLVTTAFLVRADTVIVDGDQALDTGEPPAIRFRDSDLKVERTGTDPRRFDFSGLNIDVIDLGTNRLHGARTEGEPESVALDLAGARLNGAGPIALDMRIHKGKSADSIALVNVGDIAIGGIEASCERDGAAGTIAIGTEARPAGSVRVGFLHTQSDEWHAKGGGAIAVHGSGDVHIADAEGRPGDILTHCRQHPGGDATVSHRGSFLVRHIQTYTLSDARVRDEDGTRRDRGWPGTILLNGGNSSGDAEIQGDVRFSSERRSKPEPGRFEVRHYRNVRIGGAVEGYSSRFRRRASDVRITDIPGDIEIAGPIDLERRTWGQLRSSEPDLSGRLILDAGGTVTLAELDLRLVSEALLSSGGGTGASAIRGELTGLDPFATSGTGTADDPFVSSQTILRAPKGARIYYNIAQGKNAAFAPFSYRVADADGQPGKGGLLTPHSGVPAITASEPREEETGKVVLPGRLIGTGKTPATVAVYWSEGGDRGTDAAAWAHTHAWEPHTGALPADYTHAIAVQPATRYTYRFAVRNAEGEMWTAPQNIARIARMFDIESIRPARWLNGADAAVSFTWDDNLASQRDIATIFNEYGWRTSFFVNPGQTERWEATQDNYAAMSQEGHEIGNHSYEHLRRRLSDIVPAIAPIEALTGIYPVSYVHPFNLTSRRTDELVFEHHLVARISAPYGVEGRVLLQDPGRLTGFQRNLDRITEPGTTKSGGWLIAAGHGMDGEGFRPIEEAQLRAILDHLKTRPEPLWVGTMGEVGIYESMFQDMSLEIDYTYDTLTLRAIGFDQEKYARALRVPLTVEAPLRAPLEVSQLRLSPDDASAQVRDSRLLLTFDLKQTETLTLSLR